MTRSVQSTHSFCWRWPRWVYSQGLLLPRMCSSRHRSILRSGMRVPGKNPFILKTAPVVEEKKSFARDLVLERAFQMSGGDVTVVVTNTKTNGELPFEDLGTLLQRHEDPQRDRSGIHARIPMWRWR